MAAKKIERVLTQTCKFNPLTDAQEVISHLSVDITDMLKTGVVKDSAETLDNNGIENPNEVLGLVRDVFDAMDASRIIKKYGKKSPQKAAEGVKEIANNEK